MKLSAKTGFLAVMVASSTMAGELTVQISGAPTDTGIIGCSLFVSKDGFPMDGSKATQQSHKPVNGAVTCEFADLAAGSYAVASAHDANGNGKTDTNFLGIPKEVWGVSNNPRPKLRAPTFDEARFTLAESESLTINIKLDK